MTQAPHSSPLSHVATEAWLLPPSSSSPLPSHLIPAAREALSKSADLYLVTPLLKPPPTSPISQSKSWRPWCTQDSPSSVSMHAPVLSHHILTAHPCSLHFLTALVSKTFHKHSHLRDFVFSLPAVFTLRCPYERLPCPTPVLGVCFFIQISHSYITHVHCSTITSYTSYLFILLGAFLPRGDISSMGRVNFNYFVHCWVPATRTAPH